jgi:hypothetical protein
MNQSTNQPTNQPTNLPTYRPTYLPTYLPMYLSIQLHVAATCMRNSAGRAILRILWVPKFHYRDHKIRPLFLTQSQINPLHALPCYCFNLSLIPSSQLDPNLQSCSHRYTYCNSRQPCRRLAIKWFNCEADLFTSHS